LKKRMDTVHIMIELKVQIKTKARVLFRIK
jgi:hypothetical protein